MNVIVFVGNRYNWLDCMSFTSVVGWLEYGLAELYKYTRKLIGMGLFICGSAYDSAS